MKTGIHPKYFENVEIRCSCGNVILAGSTKESLKTELCSKCHPFYTGQQKLVDTAGRVDKFMARRKKSESLKEEAKHRLETKKRKPEAYQEKIVPEEVLKRAAAASKGKGKWGKPLGDSPAEEIVKEEILEAKRASKKSKEKQSSKKTKVSKKK